MDNRNFTPADAMALAGSSAGQKLIRLLQEKGGENARVALEKAAAGDYSRIGVLFALLRDNPEAAKLLQELGGAYGKQRG